jgi:hypothetical protein
LSLFLIPVAWAADSATVVSVDKETGTVTVRNDQTGRLDELRMEFAGKLESLKPGDVLAKPDVLDVQVRSSQGPPRMSGKEIGQSCVERCMNAPGTTYAQCWYWCKNQ